MEKVENVNRPLKKGELFLVPCLVNGEWITPVINHPHNDVENGQKEVHYHADFRFIKYVIKEGMINVTNKHSKHKFCENPRPTEGKIEYIVLPVVGDFAGETHVSFIAKSKLKHKCIHKGKCPHRGYDLAQVKPKNGLIECPLHGLKFNAETKKLISQPKTIPKGL